MFSQKLKALRKEKGITQQKLADEINISRSTIAGYEIEDKQPSYEVMTRIAQYFSVSTDYLLDNSDNRFPDQDLEWRYPHISNRLGNILIKYREKEKLSQENFSKTLDIDQETYMGIENGVFVPSIQLIQKIASITGYEVDYLTGAINHTSIPSSNTIEINGGSFCEYYNESDFTFRTRFEELCLQNNITNENCDKKLAFTQREFIDIRFNRMPTLSELLRIAYTFNVSLDYLIGRTDYSMFRLTDDEIGLILNYRDCLPQYQKNIYSRTEKLSITSIDEKSVAADDNNTSFSKTGTDNLGK